MTDQIEEALRSRFLPYPEYRDTGVGWLGEIPAHWDIQRTKFAARLRSGHTPSRQNPQYWKDCTIPWFGLSDVWQIRDGEIEYVHDTAEKISELGLANSAARLLPKGTVILSRTASVGFSAILGVDMATTQDFVNWICGVSLRPEYLLYVFRAMDPEFRRLTMGSTHQTIYMHDVSAFVTPIPSISEQDQIVAFIRSETANVDTLVAKKERLIELLQEKRTALITHAVTQGLDPNVPMKDSDVPLKDSGVAQLGDIPAHWEVKRLGYLARIGNGSTPNRNEVRYWLDGTYPWLTSAKINERVIETADQFVTEAALRECHLPSVPAGSVLVAITGEGQTRGRAALLRIESTISQHLAFMTPQRSDVYSAFLVRLLEARYQWLRDESSGSGSTRGALTCEFLKSLRCAFPPREEQLEIAELLDRETTEIDALIDKIREAIEHLNEFRAALISAAVTGKIDVREEVPA